MKSRIFNISQETKHPVTGETLLTEDTIKIALAHKTISKWCYVFHDKDIFSQAQFDDYEKKNGKAPAWKVGDHKADHWHIVLQMGSNLTETSTIAKWLGIPENYVEVPKGNGSWKFYDCVKYLTHEDEKQQALGKYLYPDSEIHSNFDWRKKLNQRAENQLKYGKDLNEKEQMEYDVLYDGKTLRQCIAEDKLTYMNNFERLGKMRMQNIAMQRPPKTRLNYYVTGKGGIGKGLICRALARSMYPKMADEDVFFEVGAKGAAFEGYDGQPVIIWNDRRAVDLLQELNGRGNVFNVFDTHPTRQKQNIKYSSMALCNEVNIVNSVQPYPEFLDGLAGSYTDKYGEEHLAEDENQSRRRFPFMLVLHEEDFDLLINKGFLENTNNFSEYIQYGHIIGNMQKIADRCGTDEKLAQEIASQCVAPVIEQHNLAKEKFDKTAADHDEICLEFADYGLPSRDPEVIDLDKKTEPPQPKKVIPESKPDEKSISIPNALKLFE